MAAELALLSITQKNIARSNQNQHHRLLNNPSSSCLMWNPKRTLDPDDDSWEVRAFQEDTGNIMGTTWPPRSYTCTFCRREFRSAQALGGHMNVHRRDRARLQQTQPAGSINPSPSSTSSTFIIPGPEFSTSGSGLCLLYQLSNPNGVFSPTAMDTCVVDHSPSTLLSISPYPHNYLSASQLTSHFYFDKPEAGGSIHNSSNNGEDMGNEELDLELRLGHKSTSSS